VHDCFFLGRVPTATLRHMLRCKMAQPARALQKQSGTNVLN
jgi:hypothetical protein